jgi:hypothetical protein
MATVEVDGSETSTDLGYGLTLTGGNEWWVSDNWGLGVATQLFYSDVPDGDTNLTTLALSVMFTATWN